MNTIYKHTRDFDQNAICDKLDEINEQIEEEIAKAPTKESNEKYRNLMYQQLLQGMRLCTGYKYF